MVRREVYGISLAEYPAAHNMFCPVQFLLADRRYQGEWSDDKMTGRGYMIWADGRRYDGYLCFTIHLSQFRDLNLVVECCRWFCELL
jgi:hypothetical protein